MTVHDVAIIGAGPAGTAAAVQLKRFGLEPLLLEKDGVGGLLRNAHLVENYPGFPEGISGLELARLFESQLAAAGVRVRFEEVLELDHHKETFHLRAGKRTLRSRIVVIASGTAPRFHPASVDSEELNGRVFHDVLPLLGIKNKTIAVIGSGDASFDYALNLSRKNRVLILCRGRQAKCLPLLWERAGGEKNISFQANVAVKKISRVGEGLRLSGDGKTGDIFADYLVIAIGRKPCLDFLSPGLKKKVKDLITAKKLFLVGDVKNGMFRQTAIAVGDGLRAAMAIHRRMEKERAAGAGSEGGEGGARKGV